MDIVTVIIGWMGSAIEQHQRRILLKMREEISSNMIALTQRLLADAHQFESVISEVLVKIFFNITFKYFN